MYRQALVALLRVPYLRALWLTVRDLTPYARLNFLYAALDSGLLRALRTPATRDDLVARLAAERPDLLDALLELGVTVKELGRRDGRYRLRGARSRALAKDNADPLAAMIEEALGYHASVYRCFAARLRGAPPGDYLREHGVLIARTSRLLEPYQRNFVRSVVRGRRPSRLLEIGCGSGVYLRHAAEARRALTGVALELDRTVAGRARDNLASWGLADRFQVIDGDARAPPDVGGPFDLVTLYNNVYYFTEDERRGLFRRVRDWLAPGGAFTLVSLLRGDTVSSLDLDLALRSTAGCTALPESSELIAQVKEAGFARVEETRLMPVEPFYGFVAEPDEGSAE